MTVSTPTNKVSYIGNGVATSFAIPFPFLEKDHLNVYQLLNDIQTERTDWTVSDGNMVFETAPAENAQIVIMRNVPLTQETDYRENEILSAETLERCFDKLTMQVQQLKEQTERAVTVDIFDDTDAAELIPSIRQSVSDAAAYAETAQTNAQAATVQATAAATSATNAAMSETNTAAMLGIKANADMDNLTTTGKAAVSNLAMLSDSFIEMTLGATETTYTAPADGAFFIGKNATSANQHIYADVYKENTFLYTCNMLSHSTESLNLLIPVSIGDSVKIRHNLSGATNIFRFIYANSYIGG
ncbi:MAG: hypothetical protein ACI4TE_03910 [Alphaproteobacteria bacterium]